MSSRSEDFIANLVDAMRSAAVSEVPVMVLVSDNSSQKRLDIHNGFIINLDSTIVGEKFAALLVMMKVISKNDLVHIVNSSFRNWELDLELIRTFEITQDKVHKIFSIQLSRIASSLSSWTNGSVLSRPIKESVSMYKKPGLPVEEFLLHVFRHKPPLSIRENIKHPHHMIYTVVSERIHLLKSLPLNAIETHIASHLLSGNPIDTLFSVSGLDQEKYLSALYNFIELGFVKLNEPTFESSKNSASCSSTPAESVKHLITKMSDVLSDIQTANYYALFNLTKEEIEIIEST